jgi:predicted MFS family arabinose efflux permease
MGAISIFEIGSLVCAVAKNSTSLTVSRAVAAMGGAALAPTQSLLFRPLQSSTRHLLVYWGLRTD